MTEWLDLLLAEPDEDGSVVRFKVAFPESVKSYTYAAVGFEGCWYLSGVPETAQRKTWAELIEWMKLRGIEVISLQLAQSWEELL